MKRLIIISVLFLGYVSLTYSQIIHYSSVPAGFIGDVDTVKWYDLTVSQSEKDALIKSKGSRGTLKFGVGRDVSLNRHNSGGVKSTSKKYPVVVNMYCFHR